MICIYIILAISHIPRAQIESTCHTFGVNTFAMECTCTPSPIHHSVRLSNVRDIAILPIRTISFKGFPLVNDFDQLVQIFRKQCSVGFDLTSEYMCKCICMYVYLYIFEHVYLH